MGLGLVGQVKICFAQSLEAYISASTILQAEIIVASDKQIKVIGFGSRGKISRVIRNWHWLLYVF